MAYEKNDEMLFFDLEHTKNCFLIFNPEYLYLFLAM